MAQGPYLGVLPDYTLTWEDSQGAFTTLAHLEHMSDRAAEVQGLDATQTNISILFADPMEGNPRIRHNMSATFSPSFDGLEGKLTIKGRPRDELIAQTEAEGLVMLAEFQQSASSVDDGGDWSEWSRVRKVRTGTRPDTKAPIYDPQETTVRLKVSKPIGDQTSDFETVSVEVTAIAGTLAVGDALLRPGESYVVTSQPERIGDFETAKAQLRSY